jgi:hypothetical protein
VKKKRTVRRRLQQKSPPVVFFVLIALILAGFVYLIVNEQSPKNLSYSNNSQVLGISKVSGFFDFLKSLISKKSSSTSSQIQQVVKLPETTSKTNREVGNAGDLYPYGKINESTVIEMPLSAKGGVVQATLSGNLKFYLIYPSNIPEGSMVTLTPYYSMPTAKNAIPLSNELGYGLDITMDTARHGELPANMYAVFDLDQGKTVSQIRKDKKLNYFCDPTSVTFNPSACAFLNNVPLSLHTNQQYAVVAPIRSDNLTHLASMEPTIPIGFENLLVVPVSKETSLIPQKLSKELLADLVKANGIDTQTTIYRTEAITQAIEHGLYTPETITSMVLEYRGTKEFEDIKRYYQLPKLKAYINKLQHGTNLSDDEKVLAEKLSGFSYDFV